MGFERIKADKMTLREKQARFGKMLGLLLVRANDLGTPIVILELYRSVEQEKKNIANGSSHLKDPNNCKHCQGLAVDICFLADLQDDGKLNYQGDKYLTLGTYWEMLTGVWGGRWKMGDFGHFEYADVIKSVELPK